MDYIPCLITVGAVAVIVTLLWRWSIVGIEPPGVELDEPDPDEPSVPLEDVPDVADEHDAPPANVRMPEPNERMINLLQTNDRFEADLMRNILLENDIWCFMSGDKNALGLGEVGLSAVTLHVPDGDLFAAKKLIATVQQDQLQQQAADGRATCPACGYDLRATPDRCPECGLNFSA
ncbi:MAG: DUF2007 domain-containing protein [Planctomycetota bacterium]